jgi:glycosyltransferase involved in cell wall biosynthesis
VKIFGNCLVKNEADMIEETLLHAARWCDRIFVFDNGSTDDTWERVQELARVEPRVVPFKTSAVPFSNALRGETFRHFRHEAAEGDWWYTLDADEIYLDDPRAFLAAVPGRHHVVWGVYFQHYFTDVDAARCAADPAAYPPHTPAELALRYYRCDYSEVRFFRYRPRLVWDHGVAPRHRGIVHPRRIRFKHYQYRSPAQIDLRLRTRQQAIADGCENFRDYSSETDWRLKIVPAATCRNADEPMPYAIDESAIPRHIERPLHRLVKHFMHGTGLWA